MSDSTELVQRWLDAFNDRSEAQMLAIAHPDIVLRPLRWVPKSEYRGHEGIRTWLADVLASGNTATAVAKTIRPLDANRIIVEGMLDDEETAFVGLYEIRNGLIAGIRAYLSDRELVDQLGLLSD